MSIHGLQVSVYLGHPVTGAYVLKACELTSPWQSDVCLCLLTKAASLEQLFTQVNLANAGVFRLFYRSRRRKARVVHSKARFWP